MHHQVSRTNKFFLLLFTYGIIFWLGGITTRALIANEFFITGTLQYRDDISLDTERMLFQLITATSIVALTSYLILLVSSVYLLMKMPLKVREHGWLLIASLLFFLFVPAELFTGFLDLKFIFLWENTKDILQTQGMEVYAQHSTHLRETLSHRIGALSGVPVIAMFCYITAVVFLVWQPMKKKQQM